MKCESCGEDLHVLDCAGAKRIREAISGLEASDLQIGNQEHKQTEGKDSQGRELKNDALKLRYDLIPWEVLEALAQVFTYGLIDHDENSWKKVDVMRYYAADQRHTQAWRKGTKLDKESGYPHLAHKIWNAAVMYMKDIDNLVGKEIK